MHAASVHLHGSASQFSCCLCLINMELVKLWHVICETSPNGAYKNRTHLCSLYKLPHDVGMTLVIVLNPNIFLPSNLIYDYFTPWLLNLPADKQLLVNVPQRGVISPSVQLRTCAICRTIHEQQQRTDADHTDERLQLGSSAAAAV